jgi:GMP synthase (glutamine-hydrolysing)
VRSSTPPDSSCRKLDGVTDPERKRKIIGRDFIDVFQRRPSDRPAQFLAQGTLYPDVIESSPCAALRGHQEPPQRGRPAERMQFKLVEPLRELFKDEVRGSASQLGLDEEFVYRQPFPGRAWPCAAWAP